jgi:hypothetical protein
MTVPWMNDEIVPRTIEIDGKTYPIKFKMYSQLQYQAYTNHWYRELWDDINNDGTIWMLSEKIIPALEKESFLIFQFFGESHSGKSWLALAKALEVKYLEEEFFGYSDVQIHFAFSHSEVTQLLKAEEARQGDVIICDEESTMSGIGSDIAAAALANILKACRAKGIHFFFCDPDPRPKPNIHAWYCVAGIVEEKFTTISIIENSSNKPIGFDITEIPIEDELWKHYINIYEPLKMANIDKMLSVMGTVGANVSIQQEEDAQNLYEYSLEKEREGIKISGETLLVFSSDLGISSNGTAYERNVIARVKMLRDTKGIGKLRRIEYDDVTRERWKITDVGSSNLPEDFLDLLEKHIEEQIPLRAAGKGLHKDAAKWFIEYCKEDNTTYHDLVSKYDTKYNTIQRNITEIRQSVFGYAVETLLASQNPDWILGGSNLPLPDFKTEERIISIKARIRRNRQAPSIQDFGKAERTTALREGKSLWLYYYEIKHHKQITYYLAEKQNSENDEN